MIFFIILIGVKKKLILILHINIFNIIFTASDDDNIEMFSQETKGYLIIYFDEGNVKVIRKGYTCRECE
jgi:hypothetical protein